MHAGQLSFKPLPMPKREDGLGDKRDDFLKPKVAPDDLVTPHAKHRGGSVRGAIRGSTLSRTADGGMGEARMGKEKVGEALVEGKVTEDDIVSSTDAEKTIGAEKAKESQAKPAAVSRAKARKRVRPALHEFKGAEASF